MSTYPPSPGAKFLAPVPAQAWMLWDSVTFCGQGVTVHALMQDARRMEIPRWKQGELRYCNVGPAHIVRCAHKEAPLIPANEDEMKGMY